jgi:hypothetical protein
MTILDSKWGSLSLCWEWNVICIGFMLSTYRVARGRYWGLRILCLCGSLTFHRYPPYVYGRVE